jgi:hypothetical protein
MLKRNEAFHYNVSDLALIAGFNLVVWGPLYLGHRGVGPDWLAFVLMAVGLPGMLLLLSSHLEKKSKASRPCRWTFPNPTNDHK